jgi:hypothetical protein
MAISIEGAWATLAPPSMASLVAVGELAFERADDEEPHSVCSLKPP